MRDHPLEKRSLFAWATFEVSQKGVPVSTEITLEMLDLEAQLS